MSSLEYDFESSVDRRGSSSHKWDKDLALTGRSGLLPFWVADMDFPAPPEVRRALAERLDHGVFGYTYRPESLDDALISWFARRHGWDIEAEQIVEAPGIVPFIHMAVQTFTEPGDAVVIQEPVYYPFRLALERNGRRPAENPLIRDDAGHWRMDFRGLERSLDESGAKLMILCSPHNPVGRVWTATELRSVARICRERDVLVVSDEIHADLVHPGHRHIPWLNLPPEELPPSISLISATKTFNLPGLTTAYAIVPDPDLRRRTSGMLEALGMGGGSTAPLAYAAAERAWSAGDAWLEALLAHLGRNDARLRIFLRDSLPGITAAPLEGTYLEWLRLEDEGMSDETAWERLLAAGAWLSKGRQFGRGGEGHLRMNIACPRRQLDEGLDMMSRALGRID